MYGVSAGEEGKFLKGKEAAYWARLDNVIEYHDIIIYNIEHL